MEIIECTSGDAVPAGSTFAKVLPMKDAFTYLLHHPDGDYVDGPFPTQDAAKEAAIGRAMDRGIATLYWERLAED